MRKEIILMLHIGYAVRSVIVAPRNAAVVAGDFMSMECRTDEESRVRRWELTRTIKEEAINVYTHGSPNPYHPEFTHFGALVNANGSGVLYTNSTRIGDAGQYACVTRRSPDAPTVKVTAQLTVLESRPVCDTNLTSNGNKSLEEDYIWFRCNVSFRGIWSPTMEWRQHSGTAGDFGRILTEGIETFRLPNTSVNSTLTIKVNSSMKGVFFSCKTNFTEYDGKPFDDSANNIPNYNYTWNSEAVVLPNLSLSRPYGPTDANEPTSSSDWLVGLLVAGLTVSSAVAIIFATVFCIGKIKTFRGQSLEPVDLAHRTSQNPSLSEPQTSTELNSQPETGVDRDIHQMASTNENYSSLKYPPVASQEPKVYCQLRLQDPQLSDYVNLPSNEYLVYLNVTEE